MKVINYALASLSTFSTTTLIYSYPQPNTIPGTRLSSLIPTSFKNWIKTDESNQSPCPAINILANYGFLKRTDIKPSDLKAAFKSAGFQKFADGPVIDAVIGADLVLLANNISWPSLKTLGTHLDAHPDQGLFPGIEHDASMTRLDAPGDNIHLNPDLYQKLKRKSWI